MLNLYLLGGIGAVLLVLVLYILRLVKNEARLNKEIEDAKRYGEVMRRAKENAIKSGNSTIADIDKRLQQYDR
jgi:hypothetical protein